MFLITTISLRIKIQEMKFFALFVGELIIWPRIVFNAIANVCLSLNLRLMLLPSVLPLIPHLIGIKHTYCEHGEWEYGTCVRRSSGNFLVLDGVYHISDIRQNLISTSLLVQQGYKVVFELWDMVFLLVKATFVMVCLS